LLDLSSATFTCALLFGVILKSEVRVFAGRSLSDDPSDFQLAGRRQSLYGSSWSFTRPSSVPRADDEALTFHPNL
jgi:hypothetical protein